MSRALILSLACQASDGDDESLVVLADLILETRWYDCRLLDVMNLRYEEHFAKAERIAKDFGKENDFSWAPHIAGVLMFGEWSTKYWPTILRAVYIGSNDGVQRVQRYTLGFDTATVPPYAEMNVAMSPAVLFRAQSLVIPETDCDGIMIENILIGNQSLFLGNSVAASVFSEKSVHNIDFPTCEINQLITIRLRNQTDSPKRVRVMMHGLAVTRRQSYLTDEDPILEAARRLV